MNESVTGPGLVPAHATAPTVRVRPARDARFGLRVLVAPGAFKESLTAEEAADAMARGVARAARRLGVSITTDVCPVSDGGEGFVRSMVRATGGSLVRDTVTGPLGEPVEAEWGVLSGQAPASADIPVARTARAAVESALDLPAGALARDPRPLEPWKTAVIEAASAAGLALVAPERRDPMKTTSFGVGELIGLALDAGCGRIIVGLGGTATVDGGIGTARALGVRLTDANGQPVTSPERPYPVGEDLVKLAHLAVNARDDRLTHVSVTVAADVTTPLIGPEGAAAVFGPQKGATPEQITRLDAGLANLAARCAESGLDTDPAAPGAGAAGGLGYGLAALLDAVITPGAPLVLERVGFAQRAARADVVLTGEGRLDATSAHGKLVGAVSQTARDAGAIPLALVGSLGDGADTAAAAMGLAACRAITPPGTPLAEALDGAGARLESETDRLVRLALTGGTG